MKRYERKMKKYEGNMKNYEGNMKKYEGIVKKYIPLYMGCGTWKNSDLRYADKIPDDGS